MERFISDEALAALIQANNEASGELVTPRTSRHIGSAAMNGSQTENNGGSQNE